MKKIMFSLMFLLVFSSVFAQDKFFTKSGKIVFDATSPKSPENIIGVNKTTTCVVDTKTGALQFAVLMKGFEFEKALMQEHFNENYVESNKFPKAEFRGALADPGSVSYSKEGVYSVKVKGKLTIHGETKDVESDGKISVKGGKVQATATFPVILSDYGVNVPQLVADKVAKIAKISIDCLLDPLK